MRQATVWLVCAFVLGVFLVPTPAYADMGIPVASAAFPSMVLMFVPVVLVEAWVFVAVLRLGFWRSILISFVANLASSLVGVPVAFWVGSYNASLFWVPFEFLRPVGRLHGGPGLLVEGPALLLEMLLLYAGSVIVESLVAWLMLGRRDPKRVLGAVALANVFSYVLLILATAVVWRLSSGA